MPLEHALTHPFHSEKMLRIDMAGAGEGSTRSTCESRGVDTAPSKPSSVIEGLRAKVRAIEQPPVAFDRPMPGDASPGYGWTLGIDGLDAALGGKGAVALASTPEQQTRIAGLDPAGLHEIKPAFVSGASAAASQAIALGFVLRLALRRLGGLVSASRAQPHADPPILWCQPTGAGSEMGRLYGYGLVDLGLDPGGLVLVETARAADTLWAMEEALRSGAVALVIGLLDEVQLTPARRLSLAAHATTTPCLIMTHANSPVMAATQSRWRIGLTPSPPDPLDASAPGGFAARVRVERCRANPNLAQSTSFVLEWCDETHRFGLPAAMAYRAPRARPRTHQNTHNQAA